MATDYERTDPVQSYAERRGITFRARVAQIMRRLMPERVRDAVDDVLDRLRPPGDGVPGAERVSQPGRENAGKPAPERQVEDDRSEEHTSELQSLMRSSYAVLCLNKKKTAHNHRLTRRIEKPQAT